MVKKINIFPCLMPLFLVVQLFNGCRWRVRVLVQYACNRAGCVDRDGEGSTGPSRGEHRLTVYRAHASLIQIGERKNREIRSQKSRNQYYLWKEISPEQFSPENDSESPPCLKSNIGAGKIWFFGVTNYLCISHPSIEKISRLTLQNSFRVCLDLKKHCSFCSVWSNLHFYSYRKIYQ